MKVSKGVLSSIVLVCVFFMSACNNSNDKGEGSVQLMLGHALPEGTPASNQIYEAASAIEEETDGRVTFDIFPESQLGSETEMLEQIRVGTMDAGAIMVGSMQSFDKKMAIEDLPYMWADINHARDAYAGEFGEAIADIMKEQNITKIGYLEWGFRHITNNDGPIVEPRDLQGLNIRVAETALRVDTFEQVGALPTVMSFSEVYGALQQGAIDAQENPLANIVAPSFYEVQDYLSLTGHFYNTVMVMVETDTWNIISEEDQQIILNEFNDASKRVQKENDDKEEEYLSILKENGMEINHDVNVEAFREAMSPVYAKWEKEVFGKELMDTYRAASGFE